MSTDKHQQQQQRALVPLRLYIAGPMTGRPALNFPAFIAAALQLRGLGFDAVNPVDLNMGVGPADQQSPEYATHWRQCMRTDIKALADCDGVALLPGWQDSKGAQLERHIAVALGLDVRPLNDWITGTDSYAWGGA